MNRPTTSTAFPALAGKYDAINIKLDKTGGLTGALALARAAQGQGLQIMVGCMLATSLAMAPAMLVAQFAHVVDLDGPLLLKNDRAARHHLQWKYHAPAAAGIVGLSRAVDGAPASIGHSRPRRV